MPTKGTNRLANLQLRFMNSKEELAIMATTSIGGTMTATVDFVGMAVVMVEAEDTSTEMVLL